MPIWETMPPDGATGVPLNVELEAVPPPYAPSTTIPIALRVAGTVDEVPLVAGATARRWRSETPLSPNTEYELVGPQAIALDTSPCDTSPVVLATFTTGDVEDTVAPADPTAHGGGCRVEQCDSGSCCGPYVARISGASWSATDDGALPIAYAFGSPDGPRTFATGGSATSYSGIGNPLAILTPIPGPSPIYAIDAAGNVSLHAATFELDFSCPLPSADAGADPDAGARADAGAGVDVDAGAPAHAGSAGCSITPAHGSGGAVAGVALVAALLAARRRRGAAQGPRHSGSCGAGRTGTRRR